VLAEGKTRGKKLWAIQRVGERQSRKEIKGYEETTSLWGVAEHHEEKAKKYARSLMGTNTTKEKP